MQDCHLYDSSTFAIRATSKAIERAMDIELRRRSGMTIGQSRVIGCLYLVKDGMAQAEIADKLGIEAPTLVPMIDNLQKSGLVERKVDPNDRRTKLVFLLPASKPKWDSIVDCAKAVQNISQKGIQEDEVELSKRVLKKMRENVLQFILEKKEEDSASPQKLKTIPRQGVIQSSPKPIATSRGRPRIRNEV